MCFDSFVVVGIDPWLAEGVALADPGQERQIQPAGFTMHRGQQAFRRIVPGIDLKLDDQGSRL